MPTSRSQSEHDEREAEDTGHAASGTKRALSATHGIRPLMNSQTATHNGRVYRNREPSDSRRSVFFTEPAASHQPGATLLKGRESSKGAVNPFEVSL